MANYLSVEKKGQIFHLLCEGNGRRSIERITGCSDKTITELQKRYAMIVDYFNGVYIKNVESKNIEADEIKTFIGTKKNVKWVYIAMDRDTRVTLHFYIGARDTIGAKTFLSGLSDKLARKTLISTDCLRSYVAAVEKTPQGFTPIDTIWVEMERSRKLSSDPSRWITNRVENQNGNVRQHVSKLRRKTRCFARSEASLISHLKLYFFYYNFMKKHKALKTTPAIYSGIVDKVFTIDDLVQYDVVMSKNVSNINNKKNYGKPENKITKSEKELFIEKMKEQRGMKKGTARMPYKKLKIA